MIAMKPQKQILSHGYDCGKESISAGFIRFFRQVGGKYFQIIKKDQC